MLKPESPLVAFAAFSLLVLASAGPAAAQQSITITQNGTDRITSTNSGDVSLNGTVTNPTVSGTNNTAGTLTAQGASSSYSINDANYDATGNPVGTYTAQVSDVRTGGSNSGSVNVRASITGGSLTGNNLSQSVSATGYSNTISIKTTGK